eukprot:625474-Prymnesium_polylepis.1
MKVGALSSMSANSSTVVICALLSIISGVDASERMVADVGQASTAEMLCDVLETLGRVTSRHVNEPEAY